MVAAESRARIAAWAGAMAKARSLLIRTKIIAAGSSSNPKPGPKVGALTGFGGSGSGSSDRPRRRPERDPRRGAGADRVGDDLAAQRVAARGPVDPVGLEYPSPARGAPPIGDLDVVIGGERRDR